ncbi:hypothetical protein N657DRAFT_646263 [Parathielavia appendiculata]|uniref:Septation initiation network scaffold protein cdc11 n=1 Tax=Parathielavia appendiculata TaxID=2587402 RepID=A0AAN6TXG2_9PEZI|nr:hypothetical protein N657DRAFT_646263 [Parathielavia appendiculata]
MGHAWLDSLSEDWVSQPGSPADASFAEAAPSPSPDTRLPPKPKTPSRIPRLSPHTKKSQQHAPDSGVSNSSNGSSNILSERNINERLAALSRRTPSKLAQELSPSPSPGVRDCHACLHRSTSTSTTNSVVRKTFHRKSMSASQAKGKGGETPEWKRRLVYGDLSYGEQRDLFTSAGTGLENIFKPPQATPGPSRDGHAEHSHNEQESQMDVTVPPSPALCRRDPSTVEIQADDSTQEPPPPQPPKRAPTGMRYRRSDEEEPTDASRQSEFNMPQDYFSRPLPNLEQTGLSDGADGESRKVSGRSDIRHEDFSPILLEMRQASNGKTIFGPAELPPDELRKRLEKLRQNQMLLTGGPNGDFAANRVASRNIETTQDCARLDGFVNFQRGGRSEEGSFRNRMLSSALNDSSELNPEESLQASTPKQFPTVRVERWASSELVPADSPDLPRVPDPSPEKRHAPVNLSPGSPLKLFQPYDTFTSQTLLRRLSQMHGEAADSSFSIAVDPDSRLDEYSPSRLLPPPGYDQRSTYANRFGAGELDGYEFNDEFSHVSRDVTGLDGNKENREPEEDSMLASHQPIFDLTHNSSPSEAPDIVVNRRRKSTTSHPSRRPGRASFPGYVDLLQPHGGRRDASGPESKRPRTSPTKDPTPKRRRTLHRSDVSYVTEDLASILDSVHLSHQQMQSALGRFQEDASGDRDDMADPHARPALRPRTPTPSQRSSLQRERQPFAEIERSPARSSRLSQTHVALPVGTAMETNRKPSIKTEDFINEANKIMAMIRSKAGLPSGLASVEESDEERAQASPELDGSFEESTLERFSRPPSREGRPPLTRMSTKQENPVLAEQLKKYEETGDMGDMITSSVRSARLTRQNVSAAQEVVDERNDRQSCTSDWVAGTISDPPNVQLSRNPDLQQQQAENQLSDGMPSQGSAGFNTQSTGIPTGSSRGSSRGSEARKTIMPESVSHLIPDQVGNMILDRQRNIWVKRKGSGESKESFSQFEMSEDDPFAGIPDLSVDVTKEMQNLMLTGKKELALQDLLPGATQISPSRSPRMSSFTRRASDAAGEARAPFRHSIPTRAEEAVEHEINIHEGQVKEPRRLTISFSSPVASVIQDAAGIRDMLSEDSIPDQSGETQDLSARGRMVMSIRTATGDKSARPRSSSRGPPRHLSVRGKSLMARPVSRIEEREEDSGLNQAQYQEAASGMELSVLGDYSIANRDESGRQVSLSFMVATPARAPSCPAAGVDAAHVISQYVGTFSLSPLSEFTIHHAEETLPMEASYVVDNHRLVTGDQSRRVMSISMRELVEKLAEVEPFEPYWEDMQELELREKGLSALHALDEFCGQLESLDVSKNKIRNLGGVPSSVRHLRMTHNQLSSLTAWNHLINLQYVDVSNNGLTSLAAFQNLIHLRSLKADNNQITSLDGIKFHKGLQTLRARGNLIDEIDLDGNTLHQLTDLDLKNNQITRIAHVGQLPSLSSLNLEGNRLSTFSIESSSDSHPMTTLRYLRLDDNKLTTLNVAKLPHLRLLHADRNALVQIAGFSRARRIDSLSLREQRGEKPLDLSYLLSRAYEVRKLYLSGNLLGEDGFAPKIDLLNLQLLELANCGLGELPEEVGLMMPNLRVCNLNMNALSDVGALRAVPRLKRLFVAGNRLADPAGLVKALEGWRHLTVLDVRDNPLTQGFYAPTTMQGVVVQRGSEKEVEGDGGEEGGETFVLGDQDAGRDEKYCARLDMDTRVRRRLWETMVRKRCARVRKLDGLVLRRLEQYGRDGGSAEGDVVWLAMKEKGLVKVNDGGEEEVVVVEERSARWPAEDSFA